MTYKCLIIMHGNAQWACEVAYANGNHERAIRYHKIMCRIEKAMWNYPGVNVELTK